MYTYTTKFNEPNIITLTNKIAKKTSYASVTPPITKL